ncbi:MAG: TRAP transporter large permease [Pseudomonadota bacterium]
MSLTFLWLFVILMLVGLPVVFVLLLAPGISLLMEGKTALYPQLLSRLYNGMFSFPLMAIPFFILAGELMNTGGITQRLVQFAHTLIGHVRGGLAQVNILSSIMFAGLSGSAVADTSAIGSMLIPAMEKGGYTRRFAAAVTAASSVIGPIIPPSGIMILYAFIMNISPAALFAAGFVPGLLVGIGLMTVTAYLARKRNYPIANKKASWGERGTAFRHSFLPLLTPVILLGGSLGGIFTPTEAAAVAAGYALFISLVVLRTMSLRDLPRIFYRAALASGTIMLLVGAAVAFGWIVTISGAARELTAFVVSVSEDPLLLLFLFNIMLLIVGMFLDAGPAILILGPLLKPVFVTQLGVDELHFAIIMCVNVTVGLATPPMGLILFVASSLTGERIERIAREMLPFLAIEIAVIFLITYVPSVSLTIPKLLGLY